ncbi:MAG: hypothetical protein ACM65M_15240 [Microcoleus sp.]
MQILEGDAPEYWPQKVKGLSIISEHGYLSKEQENDLQETLKRMQPPIIFVVWECLSENFGLPKTFKVRWLKTQRSLPNCKP